MIVRSEDDIAPNDTFTQRSRYKNIIKLVQININSHNVTYVKKSFIYT